MRYVPSIASTRPSPVARQVRGLTATQAVKPVYPREQPAPPAGHLEPHQEAVSSAQPRQQRAVTFEDRRKTCRRVSHHPVLVELRSGFDRRRRNLREGDIVEHIDEKA
jgi:hypothetical protein